MESFNHYFNKLTEAYIKDEVNPFSNCQCWIGNMFDNRLSWCGIRVFRGGGISSSKNPSFYPDYEIHRDTIEYSEGFVKSYGFSPEEVINLEYTFLKTLKDHLYPDAKGLFSDEISNERVLELPGYEDALFKAFENTLDELRNIYINKGLPVDLSLAFTKRKKELA